MLPAPRNYAIYPQVVPADKPTEMTIVPTERAFLLFEGKEYTVIVTSLDDDETDYHDGGTCHHKLTAVIEIQFLIAVNLLVICITTKSDNF